MILNEEKLMLLASMIKQKRKDLGFSQKTLALKCETDERTIQRIESGFGGFAFNLIFIIFEILIFAPADYVLLFNKSKSK